MTNFPSLWSEIRSINSFTSGAGGYITEFSPFYTQNLLISICSNTVKGHIEKKSSKNTRTLLYYQGIFHSFFSICPFSTFFLDFPHPNGFFFIFPLYIPRQPFFQPFRVKQGSKSTFLLHISLCALSSHSRSFFYNQSYSKNSAMTILLRSTPLAVRRIQPSFRSRSPRPHCSSSTAP